MEAGCSHHCTQLSQKEAVQAHDTIIEHLKADTSSSLEDLVWSRRKPLACPALGRQERKTAFIDWSGARNVSLQLAG